MKQQCGGGFWWHVYLFILAVFILEWQPVCAQRLYSPTNPFQAPVLLNPAHVGNGERMRLSMLGQSQWMGIRSPYNHYGVTYDMHFGMYDNHSMGLSINNDVEGPHVLQWTAFMGYYAYMFDITYDFRMRMGVGVGAVMRSTNYAKLEFLDGMGPLYGGGRSKFIPDLSLGVACEYLDWRFGASCHHVAGSAFVSSLKPVTRIPQKVTVYAYWKWHVNHLYRFKPPLYVTPFFVGMWSDRQLQLTLGGAVEYLGIQAAVGLKEDVLYQQHNIFVTVGWEGAPFGAFYTCAYNVVPQGPMGLNALVHEATIHVKFPYPHRHNMFSAYRRGRRRSYARYSRVRTGARSSRRYRR